MKDGEVKIYKVEEEDIHLMIVVVVLKMVMMNTWEENKKHKDGWNNKRHKKNICNGVNIKNNINQTLNIFIELLIKLDYTNFQFIF